MASIWAALKSLGAIAGLFDKLLDWFREMQRKHELDKADELHTTNADRIRDAFHAPPLPGMSDDSAATGQRGVSPGAPAIPGRKESGTRLVP